jgi:hypothetical protein
LYTLLVVVVAAVAAAAAAVVVVVVVALSSLPFVLSLRFSFFRDFLFAKSGLSLVFFPCLPPPSLLSLSFFPFLEVSY